MGLAASRRAPHVPGQQLCSAVAAGGSCAARKLLLAGPQVSQVAHARGAAPDPFAVPRRPPTCACTRGLGPGSRCAAPSCLMTCRTQP